MKYVQEMFYLCNCRVSCQSIIYALLVVLQWNRQKCFWSILKDDHYGTPNRLTLTWISNVLVDIKIYRYTMKLSSSSSHTLQYFCLSRVILEYSKVSLFLAPIVKPYQNYFLPNFSSIYRKTGFAFSRI